MEQEIADLKQRVRELLEKIDILENDKIQLSSKLQAMRDSFLEARGKVYAQEDLVDKLIDKLAEL